jgi:RNA polymerase sigma-70 factor, ECF subfamily
MECIEQIARINTSHSRKLKRFLWRFERTVGDVEDIIQDAMVEAMRCSDRFLAQSSVETWFYGIAANVARGHVARSVMQGLRTDSLDLLRENAGDAAANLTNPATFGDAVELREFTQRLDAAIAQLPRDLRITFDLACLQELSYREIADALLIPIGTVRSRVNRARTLLKASLGEHAPA